jgi:predicted adenine nucleotide alpha hydrolase (AANH) superfamily ATPase
LNFEDALKNSKLVEQSYCGCSFGICNRNEECTDPNALDYYEPHEVQLEKDGLPWFYFVNQNKLKAKDKKNYEIFFMNLPKD